MPEIAPWFTESVKPHGWPAQTAAAEFPWSADDVKSRFVSVRPPADWQQRSGYDVSAPQSNDEVRRHHAADDLRDAYALPLGVHSGIEYVPSEEAVAQGKAGDQKFSVLRFESLVSPARIRSVARAYRRMWTVRTTLILVGRLLISQLGVRTSKPEDARGSDPAIHCGFWIVYHQVGSPPGLTSEGDPKAFRPEQWAAYRAWLVEASVLGWLYLRAIEIVDPALAARHKR